MEVCVQGPGLRCYSVFPHGSVVRELLTRFVPSQSLCSEDFYVIRNGRRLAPEAAVQQGAVYHLQPRLCGGKGGFGSMLRALGAQIEKTTNREACRDLSGRRLRDVNHEKEMAEWLKKQADREAEKEQRRIERLQRKLSDPKHKFTDPQYQQQCQDLSERLEDSVLKGLQASSSRQVQVDNVSATKRPSSDPSEQPQKKKKTPTAAACFWMGVDSLDELVSSEDDDDNIEFVATSSSSLGAVTMTAKMKEMLPEQSSSSSLVSAHQTISVSEEQEPPEARSSDEQEPLETRSSEEQEPAETRSSDEQEPLETRSSGEQEPAETRSSDEQEPLETRSSEEQEPAETRSSEEQEPLETRSRQEQKPPETRSSEEQESPETRGYEKQVPPVNTVSEEMEPSIPAEVSSGVSQQQRSSLDLSSVVSVSQLESLGLDVLKQELTCRGLKCGGTLSERAARLFSIRGLTPDQISPALLAKAGKTKRK